MTTRLVALALAVLVAGCGTYESTYSRRAAAPRELVLTYHDNRFRVTLAGQMVAESGDWGGLSQAVSCAPEARTWAESAASRAGTGTIFVRGGVAMMIGGVAAGTALVVADAHGDTLLIGGLGALSSVVIGLIALPTGLYLRADADTRAIDAVNRYNDEVWSGGCARSR